MNLNGYGLSAAFADQLTLWRPAMRMTSGWAYASLRDPSSSWTAGGMEMAIAVAFEVLAQPYERFNSGN
jgi:hypothetical protein